MKGAALVCLSLCACSSAQDIDEYNVVDYGQVRVEAGGYIVHNPHNVAVSTVHMIQSAHFDAGCKTPSCGALAANEPNLCARVGAGNAHGATDPTGTGEPFNYHIINRYFDEYLMREGLIQTTRECTVRSPG